MSIDDPAVSGFFIELVPLVVEPLVGGPRAVESSPLPRPAGSIANAKIPDVQASPIGISIALVPTRKQAADGTWGLNPALGATRLSLRARMWP